MARKKKDKSIELISKTIIEEGTDKVDVEQEVTEEETPVETVSTVSVGNLSSINIPQSAGGVANKGISSLYSNGVINYNTGAPYSNPTDVNNFLQTVYDLGYSDGKGGRAKRELKIDKDTGKLRF